jgi:hypothetical protein
LLFNRHWCSHATAKLHNAAFCEVVTSRYAKAALGVDHRMCALTGLQNRRYAKLPTLKRLPDACTSRSPRALRAAVCRPYGVLAPWHWSGAARCVVGQWPAASHVVCAPAHPCASPLRGISPARRSARLPPKGRPQSGAKTRRLSAAAC